MHQITQTHFQGRGNSLESINGNIFLATLNIANVIVVQISFFSELFLAPPHVPAMHADVFA